MKKSAKTDRPARRSITLVYEDAPGKNVMVAGCFNNWQPTKALIDKDGCGVYSCRLLLEPGEYQYKFVIDGEWRLDNANPNFVPNEFGSLNSVLVVDAKK